MIPKIIHYCWFGGKPLTELAEKCLNSWQEKCPNYKIVRWDESNYDIKKNQYMYQAYKAGKLGFVPDYARLDIIYNHGGVYLDTDVELVRNLDDICNSYNGFAGFERKGAVALGLGFGAKAHNPIIKEMLKQYDTLSFYNADGSLNLTPSPHYQTQVLSQYNIDLNNIDLVQDISKDFIILPKSVLNPVDLDTDKLNLNNETVSIHHYAGSWISKKNKLHKNMYHILCNFLGLDFAKKIKSIYNKI